GAGKSIIIDAVGALLGSKIGAEYVRAGCERATIEGVFSINPLPTVAHEWEPMNAFVGVGSSSNGASTMFESFEHAETQRSQRHADANSADAGVALATLLHDYGIEPDNELLVLSRDISRSGRTIARINGRIVNQQTLQSVASWLIDIHGQTEHMSLLRPEQHVNFLDRYAELLPLREE